MGHIVPLVNHYVYEETAREKSGLAKYEELQSILCRAQRCIKRRVIDSAHSPGLPQHRATRGEPSSPRQGGGAWSSESAHRGRIPEAQVVEPSGELLVCQMTARRPSRQTHAQPSRLGGIAIKQP